MQKIQILLKSIFIIFHLFIFSFISAYGRDFVYRPDLSISSPFLYHKIFYEFGDINERNSNESGLGAWVSLNPKIGINIDLRWVHQKRLEDWEVSDFRLLTNFKYSI